ncbi:hypothetical protein BWI17_21800 [Betaproteobacteria bacterium GR16-43]|nr:hypothetical protein BWI17_21800 [Betaproteobacteria bacterium GR16-43]
MTNKPWYRERWPWILMSGPLLVVVAGTATAVIAFTGADGVVADDYYKRGLAINRTLAREARATSLGLVVDVRLEAGRVVARLEAKERLPERIQLTLAHPTRAGEDRVVFLARTADGGYEAPLADIAKGRWRVILETREWRWSGAVVAGA